MRFGVLHGGSVAIFKKFESDSEPIIGPTFEVRLLGWNLPKKGYFLKILEAPYYHTFGKKLSHWASPTGCPTETPSSTGMYSSKCLDRIKRQNQQA